MANTKSICQVCKTPVYYLCEVYFQCFISENSHTNYWLIFIKIPNLKEIGSEVVEMYDSRISSYFSLSQYCINSPSLAWICMKSGT